METGPKIVRRGRKPGTTTKALHDPSVVYLVGIRQQTVNLLWNIDQLCLAMGIPVNETTGAFKVPKTLASFAGKAA